MSYVFRILTAVPRNQIYQLQIIFTTKINILKSYIHWENWQKRFLCKFLLRWNTHYTVRYENVRTK